MRATTGATAVRVCGSVAARSSSSSRVPPPTWHAAAPTVQILIDDPFDTA
jgi:hypothetical protein